MSRRERRGHGDRYVARVRVVEAGRVRIVPVTWRGDPVPPYRELCELAHRFGRDRRPFDVWLDAVDELAILR